MSWKKILILSAVIAVIHLILILGVTGGCEKKESSVDQGKSPEIAGEGAIVPEKSVRQEIPPPSRKVEPWKFGKNQPLPSRLAGDAKKARSVIIVDLASRKVLWEKNSRQAVPVASLTKLMTALLVAEKLSAKDGLALNDTIEISPAAAAVEGRRFAAGEKLSVKDLIAAMMICSSNDAAAQLAQTTAGNVNDFVRNMNARADEMGLTSVNFNSPNGLPQGKSRTNSMASAADILHLCQMLMKFKPIMDVCGESYAKLSNGKEVFTTNGLLKYPTKARPYWRRVPGLFGFKTGYTRAAGCCLAFGVTRKGKTVLGCVTGFPSSADRERFCSDLIEWAYRI